MNLFRLFLKNIALFACASISISTVNNFPQAFGSLSLKELPVYILYRMETPRDDTFGRIVTPVVVPSELDLGTIAFTLSQYSFPVFSELTSENHIRISPQYCLIYAKGLEVTDDIKIDVHEMNIPTASINLSKNPEFNQIFQVEDNDFLVYKPKTQQFLVWKEVIIWVFFRKKLHLWRMTWWNSRKQTLFRNCFKQIIEHLKKSNQ
jgi:hypothetical protein